MNSLPQGPATTPAQAMSRVVLLPAVQAAQSEFGRRGYVRTASLDSVAFQMSSTTVLLGYAVPGFSAGQAQAYVIVVTKRMDQVVNTLMYNADTNDWMTISMPVTVYGTQVSGGVVAATASDSILFINSPTDPAIAVTSSISPTPGALSSVGGNYRIVPDANTGALPFSSGQDYVGVWLSSYDVYGFSAAGGMWSYYACQCPEAWREIETASAVYAEVSPWVGLYGGGFGIGFGFAELGLLIFPPTTELEMDALVMRYILFGAAGGAANDAQMWLTGAKPGK